MVEGDRNGETVPGGLVPFSTALEAYDLSERTWGTRDEEQRSHYADFVYTGYMPSHTATRTAQCTVRHGS